MAVGANAAMDTDIRTMIAVAADEFGPVDIYVANAGVIGQPGLVRQKRIGIMSST